MYPEGRRSGRVLPLSLKEHFSKRAPRLRGLYLLQSGIMTQAYLFLFLAMLSIQAGAGVAKQLFLLAGPAGMSVLRLFFASIILWMISKPWKRSYSRPQLRALAFYGVSLGLMNLSFYLSLKRIPLGIAVSLEFIGPLSVAIFSSRKKIDFLWVLLAGLGIFLILPETLGDTDLMGIMLALLAGGFWAGYIVFGKRVSTDFPSGIATAMGMFFALLVVLPSGLYVDGSKIFNWPVLGLGGLVAIHSSALPYSLEMIALKKIPAKTFSILMSIEPVIACLVGLILLGEQLTILQWEAVILIILASIGSSLRHSK